MAQASTDCQSLQLFANINYFLAGDIGSPLAIQALKENGACEHDYLSEMVDYMICKPGVGNDYVPIASHVYNIPVISHLWVTLSVKCQHLLPTQPFLIREDYLFAELTFTISNICGGDLHLLWAFLIANGACVQTKLNKHVTHLIVDQCDGAKYKKALELPEQITLVSPDWVMDSVECGMKLPCRLYHPKRLIIDTAKEKARENPQYFDQNEYADKEISPSGNKENLKERVQNLSSNQCMTSPNYINGKPKKLNGLETPVKRKDVWVEDFEPIEETPIKFHITSILSNLEDTCEEVEKHVVDKNAIGEVHATAANLSLKLPFYKSRSLAGVSQKSNNVTKDATPKLCRPNITKSRVVEVESPEDKVVEQLLGKQNVCVNKNDTPVRVQKSPRFQKHNEIKQNESSSVVNSYHSNCALPNSSINNSINMQQDGNCGASHKYVSDHSRLLYGFLFHIEQYGGLCDMNEWQVLIEAYGGSVQETFDSKVTHLVCENTKSASLSEALLSDIKCTSAFWLHDVLRSRTISPPSWALHLPLPFTEMEKPAVGEVICITGFTNCASSRGRVIEMIDKIGAEYTGTLTYRNTVLVCRKPYGLKYDGAKKLQIPTVNVRWLSDLLMGSSKPLVKHDLSNYHNFTYEDPFSIDKDLVCLLMESWKGCPDISVSSLKNDVGLETHQDGVCVRVLFTHIRADLLHNLQRIVEDLGGLVCRSDTDPCTHLVMADPKLTKKFFCGINSCKFILKPDWILHCSRVGRFTVEADYAWQSKDFKVPIKSIRFDIEHKLRAVQMGPPVLTNYTVFFTQSAGSNDMKDVVRCCGGKVIEEEPSVESVLQRNKSGRPIIIISSIQDLKRCTQYMTRHIPIQSTDFLYRAIFTHILDFHYDCLPSDRRTN